MTIMYKSEFVYLKDGGVEQPPVQARLEYDTPMQAVAMMMNPSSLFSNGFGSLSRMEVYRYEDGVKCERQLCITID